MTAIYDFMVEQAVKTKRRPSRVLRILYHHVAKPSLLPLVHFFILLLRVCRIPIAWMPSLVRSALVWDLCHTGARLLEQNRPEEAWGALERALKWSGNPLHFELAGVCAQFGLGRARNAIELYRRANQMRLAEGGSGATARGQYCLLDEFWATNIGHIAYIDHIIKRRLLDGRDPSGTILYLPPSSRIGNPFLLQQWTTHLRLVTDPRQLPFPEQTAKSVALNFYVPSQPGVEECYFWEQAAQTNRRWLAEGRQPLLRLPAEVQERGRNTLAKAGVPHDAWFVGLHVRESSFQPHHRELHNVLNAKIMDYLPAIAEITQRGGWVIRMGDPSMTELPPLPNVLDYCRSPIRSDWMDVFLAATSRFFIGTSSGVCYVAQNYGVPCVLTNWWPPAQRPWIAEDIFVPKLLRRLGGGRILALKDSLDEPFGYCNSVRYLKQRHGVTVEDNDPEDIRAATVEMFERLDGTASYESNDLLMRDRTENIYASMALRLYGSAAAFGAATLARDFLRRKPFFVET